MTILAGLSVLMLVLASLAGIAFGTIHFIAYATENPDLLSIAHPSPHVMPGLCIFLGVIIWLLLYAAFSKPQS